MIHEEIEHNIVPRRYVGASNRLRTKWRPPKKQPPRLQPESRDVQQQDTPDVVQQHYGRFLPQDKAALAAKILNQVGEAS